jgi:mono/diheme cytochrome c family protein
MRRLKSVGCLLTTLVLGAALAAAAADQRKDPAYDVGGSYNFRTYCASCHGVEAKGDGPLAESLRFRPADLTLIARRNGGEFPAEMVYKIVDGRSPLKGHGGPDMPVWGDAFKNADTSFDEQKVKAKIQGIVDYLRSIQVK